MPRHGRSFCPPFHSSGSAWGEVTRPADLTAFGGEWVQAFPKDSWQNITNEFEPSAPHNNTDWFWNHFSMKIDYSDNFFNDNHRFRWLLNANYRFNHYLWLFDGNHGRKLSRRISGRTSRTGSSRHRRVSTVPLRGTVHPPYLKATSIGAFSVRVFSRCFLFILASPRIWIQMRMQKTI